MGKKKSANKQKSNRKKQPEEKQKAEMVSQLPTTSEVIHEEPAPPSVVADEGEKDEEKFESAAEKTADEAPVTVEENVAEPVESAVVDEAPKEIVVQEENKVEHVEAKQGDKEQEKEQVGAETSEKIVKEEEEKKEEKVEESGTAEEVGEDSIDGEIKEKTEEERRIAPSEPVECTIFDWERKDEDYNVEQAIFLKSYNKKFAATLFFLCPEFRYAAGIGPCETFDSEGVKNLVEKMKQAMYIDKVSPFDGEIVATEKELRIFLSEVLNTIKFCVRLACAERGYEFESGKLNVQPVSDVWGEKIDPLTELKTLKAILDEMKEPLMKNAADGQEARFWPESEAILHKVLPALETFDSKTLSENSVADCMNSIHGRIELGFDITEEEVNKMLKRSFSEDGFGEFPPTALYAPHVFKTSDHLKMIFGQLEKMSKVVDIRVKLSGIQMITRIFEQISDVDAVLVMEELKGPHPVTIEKMFGIDPNKFEVHTNDPKRAQYLKIFFTTLAETPRQEFFFAYARLVAVLKCLYLVFDAFDVNMIIFKIIATRIKEDHVFETDRKLLLNALMRLPEPLKKRLEIGPDFSTGDVTDDRESMYYQLKHIIRTGVRDNIEKFRCFLAFSTERHQLNMMCLEKAMRIAMKCVEAGSHQMMAVETLRQLNWPPFMKQQISTEFFEELLLLALSKYSVPDATTSEKKYAFIDIVFSILNNRDEQEPLEIDVPKFMEKWTNMGHPWFSVLYLSHRFPLLKSSIPAPQYPWLSADIWADDKKDEADLKNYIPLAKVPTAWPNCTDLKIIEHLVSEHVPVEISRSDLYIAMRKYVSEFTMDENWKKKLLRSFETKINFLTSHSKKDKEEVLSEIETSETQNPEVKETENVASAPNVLTKQGDEEAVEKEQDKESSVELNKSAEEGHKKTAEAETTEEAAVVVEASAVSIDDVVSEGPDEEVKEEKETAESENCSKDAETKEVVEKISTLKPLKEAGENAFIGYYEQKEWDNFEERIRAEVLRQRQERGFSNNKIAWRRNHPSIPPKLSLVSQLNTRRNLIIVPSSAKRS